MSIFRGAFLFLLLFSGCVFYVQDGPRTGSLLSTQQNSKVGLGPQVQALLAKNCNSCHGSTSAGLGGFNYVLDLKRMKQAGTVSPGSPANSKLYLRVADKTMPSNGGFTSSDIDLIRTWIAAGAEDFETKEEPTAAPSPQSIGFQSPEAVLTLIETDIKAVAAVDRPFVRYLDFTSLANDQVSASVLDTHNKSLNKLVNSLSWAPQIALSVPVGSFNLIQRIDIRNYQWTQATWALLAARYPYRAFPTATTYQTRLANVITLAGGTLPFYRGDWFLSEASAPDMYHALAQIPAKITDLETRLGINVANNITANNVVRAGFQKSNVSFANRIIERHATSNGAYWKSYDFADNSVDLRHNIFNFPLGPGLITATPPVFVPNGGEVIFNLPNGLQGYVLIDASGNRINKAPNTIVRDPLRPDRIVANGVSCIACHSAGMIRASDDIRSFVTTSVPAPSATFLSQIQAQYPPAADLVSKFQTDEQRFQTPLKRFGLTAADQDPLISAVLLYERALDLKKAASELGMSPDDLQQKIANSANLSTALGVLLLPSGTLTRAQFLSALPSALTELGLSAGP